MDLGIAGKSALVCAASKGLGKGCAVGLAREGVNVIIIARGAEALEATAARDPRRRPASRCTAVAGRHHHRGGPRRGARRLPAARHPRQQRRRPAARRFPRLGPRRLDQGARRQHADADRADQGDGRRHDRARLRPHRQHHLGRGEGADRHPRPVERRALRPDRLRRRPRAQDGRATTSRSTTCCPAPFDTDRLRSTIAASGEDDRRSARRAGAPSAPADPGAALRHAPTSSAPPAPSCAARRPATSPARTC